MDSGPGAPGPASLPPGRYGGRRRRGIPIAAVLAVGVLAGVALALWVAVAEARRPVRWQDVSAVPRGETAVVVTFRTTVDRGVTAVCAVRAVNSVRTQVGRVDVRVEGTGRARLTRVSVPTSEPAVGGDVLACRAAGEP